jgi:hypothetical protein
VDGDSIIIEDSENDDEEKYEEDEENLEEENKEIQDPLQFLLPTVEETDCEELGPLVGQMKNTLDLFERKHRKAATINS